MATRGPRSILACAWLMGMALFTVGCNPSMKFAINVALDPSLAKPGATPNVTVDLIGVNEQERPRLSAKAMTEYWNANDPTRAGHPKDQDRVEFDLRDGRTSAKLEPSDPIWKKWAEREVTYVFVLVNYPRFSPDKEGDLDARRAIIPLEGKRWKGSPKVVNVTIGTGGVTYVPAPKRPGELR
jgi:hypothetical protein